MASTAPAAQQALTDLLIAAFDGDETVSVAFARSGKLRGYADLIRVLAARDWRLDAGEQYRIESYDLAVYVDVLVPGEDSAADADARRWELIDEIHGELKRMDFKGYETAGRDLRTAEETLELYEKGWVATSIVLIAVEARHG